MNSIGTHGLAALDNDDHAAFALYMQCQAETIDALLAGQLAQLDAFLDRPTMILRPSGPRTVASGVFVNDLFNQVLYVNNDFMSLSFGTLPTATYLNIGSPQGASPVVPYPRGEYMVGASVGFDATGAVTAFSARRVFVGVFDDTLPTGPDTVIETLRDSTPDANTAITLVGASVQGAFQLRGSHGVRIDHTVNHSNAASTVTIQQDSYLWVTYMGPFEEIGVN